MCILILLSLSLIIVGWLYAVSRVWRRRLRRRAASSRLQREHDARWCHSRSSEVSRQPITVCRWAGAGGRQRARWRHVDVKARHFGRRTLARIISCQSQLDYIFTARLHVMQRTILLSQFCMSVRPSVRRVYCDKTKWYTADISIPLETAVTLVFWHEHWLAADAPFPVKYSPIVTHRHAKLIVLVSTFMPWLHMK